MARKEHPADIYKREQIAAARSFAIHFRKSPREAFTEETATIEEARRIAEAMNTAYGQQGRRACIYAVNAAGVSFPLGEGYRTRR